MIQEASRLAVPISFGFLQINRKIMGWVIPYRLLNYFIQHFRCQ